MTNAEELIDLIVRRAPDLRDAGVLSLSLEGVSVTLAPAAPPSGDDGNDDEIEEHPDPLLDPATYMGGKVPQFEREAEPDPEDR